MLGKGAINKAYCIYSSEEGVPTHVVLYNRSRFSSVEEAEIEAKRLQDESREYAVIFADISDFIPKQIYLIFRDYRNRPSIMCVREFIGGPLKDIFTEIDRKELIKYANNSCVLRNQILAFATCCLQNYEYLVTSHLDILGPKNLSVAGNPPNCHLVLVDPQSSYVSPNDPKVDAIKNDRRSRISERIDYIIKIAQDLTEDI